MNELFKKLKKYSRRNVIIDDLGNKVKYKELLTYSEEIKEKINERCFVFIYASNTIGSVMNYVACMNNKIVPYLINANSSLENVINLLEKYKPKYIFVPNKTVNDYKDYKKIYTKYDYTILKTNYDNQEELYDELAICLSTSGSTGSEKLVRISYENLITNVRQEIAYKKLDGTERPMMSIPMIYAYGLMVINDHLDVGSTILITEKTIFDEEFWDFFKKEKCTTIIGVPYHYEMLDKLHFLDKEWPHLRYFWSGGGKFPKEMYEKCIKYLRKHKKTFVLGYGQCEATCLMTSYIPKNNMDKYGTIGKVCIEAEIDLVDDNGSVITKPYVEGELVFKGKNVSLGYATKRSDLKKGDENNGILHSGDIAYYDEDMYYYLVGRKSRFLKILGNRVNLDDVENIVKKKFKLECAALGKDDDLNIFITDESKVEEVEKYVIKTLKFNKKVIKVNYINKIPRNDSGKLLYSKLMRKLYKDE